MPLQIIRQDITKIECDAIVDPTNGALIPGGGTDAAIHAAAGPALSEACRKIGHLDVGEVALTPAFDLPCKYVIFTVGPVWQDGTHGERDLLERCYHNALALAVELECQSVALPLISSGLHGFPKDQVLKIAIAAISDFLLEHELQVTLAVFDRSAYQFSEKLFRDVTAYIDDHYVAEHADRFVLHEKRMPGPSVSRPRRMGAEPVCGTEPIRRQVQDALAQAARPDLESLLQAVKAKSFALTLFRFIDERGMTDVECYKRAYVDKKTFSKIKCNENYRPGKPTVLAFAVALKLSLAETRELLAAAGLALSPGSKFDVIVEYFIKRKIYNIHEINETLFEFDQCLLGVQK